MHVIAALSSSEHYSRTSSISTSTVVPSKQARLQYIVRRNADIQGSAAQRSQSGRPTEYSSSYIAMASTDFQEQRIRRDVTSSQNGSQSSDDHQSQSELNLCYGLSSGVNTSNHEVQTYRHIDSRISWPTEMPRSFLDDSAMERALTSQDRGP
jgi:hypothetical protein